MMCGSKLLLNLSYPIKADFQPLKAAAA